MKSSLEKIKNFLLDILFPPICIVCKKSLGEEDKKTICLPCFHASLTNNTLFCSTCQARLARGVKVCHKDSQYTLAAASSYSNERVRNLVQELKYHGQEAAAEAGAELLFQYIKDMEFNLSRYLIIPVPLHWSRERKRGFNQSALIAEVLGKKINLPVISNAVSRIRNTKPQVALKDLSERKKNVKNCFVIKKPELIRGQKIIIIDDVTTTGATLGEMARVFRKIGSGRIIGLVIAKAR
jgi:ComF family protein